MPNDPATNGPALAQAYPDWMHDFNAKLMRDSHAQLRPLDAHLAAARGCRGVRSLRDRRRSARPATRKRDVTGRQWEQRIEVMRDTMIYFRNSPSILFWEAGNTVVTAGAHAADGGLA